VVAGLVPGRHASAETPVLAMAKMGGFSFGILVALWAVLAFLVMNAVCSLGLASLGVVSRDAGSFWGLYGIWLL